MKLSTSKIEKLKSLKEQAVEITKTCERPSGYIYFNFDIHIDLDGDLYKVGDWVDADSRYGQGLPQHNLRIYSRSIDKDGWISCSGKEIYEINNWLIKTRDKVHHASLPMSRKISFREKLVIDDLERIEQYIKENPSDRRQLLKVVEIIEGIEQRMRNIKKEFKLCLELNK